MSSCGVTRPQNVNSYSFIPTWSWIKTFRPRPNGRHFPDDIFKWIFLNENVWISINIYLKFIPRGPINNIPSLVQVMAWRRPGDKPLSEPTMVRLPTHICVTRPQWVDNPLYKQWHISIEQRLVSVLPSEPKYVTSKSTIVSLYINTLRPRQNGRHFADIFQ